MSLRSACDRCGLDYKFADAGDGPAIFAIFILGFLVLGGAMIAEFKFGAPVWLRLSVVTWLGATFGWQPEVGAVCRRSAG